MTGRDLYEFGPFRLDAREGLLLRQGRRVRLKRKDFETLLVLVRNAGHVVERDQLLRTLWPDTAVAEANLTQHVWILRKSLDEREDGPKYIETVPRRGYRFVAAVTPVSPEDADALRQHQNERARRRRRRAAFGGLTVLALIALAIGHSLGLTARVRNALDGTVGQPSRAPIKARPSVAVVGFKNLAGRAGEAWLSTALAEMLSTELAAGEKLRTVPGESVARMKADLALADAESLAADSLARIRTNLGTDFVVLGSYVALGEKGGGKLRLDVRIQDCVGGGLVAAMSGTGTEEGLFVLVSDIGARLRQELGAGQLSPAEAASVRASFPSSPEAARLYAAGLAKLRLFDAAAARDLLAKAVAADPEYALAHSALADAWTTLGYDEKAKEEAKRAFEDSGSLTREEGLLVEARYRLANREWEKAIEILQALRTFFPDNLDHGLRLADAQTSAGKGKEALVTVSTLRRLPPPLADDPRIDLAEASAAASLSDLQRAKASATRAGEQGAKLGARLVVARARLLEAAALHGLSELRQATVACNRALAIYREIGDKSGVAKALNTIGVVLTSQGDLAGAKRALEESLAVSREIGNKNGVAIALNNIARVVVRQGDLAAAKTMHEQALAIKREIGDRSGIAIALNNIAILVARQGNLSGARRIYEESLAISREIGAKRSVAATLDNIALLLRLQGDLGGAKKALEEALAVSGEIGHRSLHANALSDLGDVLWAEGTLAAARKRHEEALAIRREIGERAAEAESRVLLAALSIEEGRPMEAEGPAREAAKEFQAEGQIEKEAWAHEVLGRAFLAQGNRGAAEKEVDRARVLLETSGDRRLRSSVAITAARLQAASGKPADTAQALKDLSAVLKAAAEAGDLVLQLEARLALGEIELRSGESPQGRARLARLEKDARAGGFGLVARKAAEIRK